MQDKGSDAQREALASYRLALVAKRELCKIEDLFGACCSRQQAAA
jgi:hypothetical protein